MRAQASDVAVYTCVASNRAGVDNKHYSLQVLGMLPETSLLLYYVSNIKQRLYLNIDISGKIGKIGSY